MKTENIGSKWTLIYVYRQKKLSHVFLTSSTCDQAVMYQKKLWR